MIVVRSKNFFRGFVVTVVLQIAVLNIALSHPYRAALQGSSRSIATVASNLKDGSIRTSSPNVNTKNLSRRLVAFVPGAGRYQISLDEVTFKSWESKISIASGASKLDDKDVILVSGYAKKGDDKFPIGGSIYNHNKTPTLNLIMQSKRGSGRSLHLSGKIVKGKIKELVIKSVPGTTLKKLGCGTNDAPSIGAIDSDGHNHHSHGPDVGSANATPMIKIATIGTDADPEWYAKYGANSNAHIATLISAASSIYRNQIGVRLQIKSQNVFTSQSGNPYKSTDAYNLLPTFRSYALNNGHIGLDNNLYHLFSGKDFNGSVVGLAWIEVVCKIPDYAFGITQSFHAAADASIVAHEIGHNFGANHDTNDTSSLMAAYVNIPGSNYFSAFSVNQIKSHLNSSPNCFEIGEDIPDPSPTPSPVPTPNPNNPSNPSNPGRPGSPTVPLTKLKTSLTSTGILTLRVDLSAAPKDGCRVVIYGSPRRNTRGNSVTTFTPSGRSTIFRIGGIKRPVHGGLLSFVARYRCPNGITQSDFSNVSLGKIRSRTSYTSSRILSAIKSAFGVKVRKRKLS